MAHVLHATFWSARFSPEEYAPTERIPLVLPTGGQESL